MGDLENLQILLKGIYNKYGLVGLMKGSSRDFRTVV